MIGNQMGTLMGMNGVLAALLFGVIMAVLVSWARRAGMLRRGSSLYSTMLFIIGLAGTLLISYVTGMIDLTTAANLVITFAFSGMPMIFESFTSDHYHKVEKELGQ